MDLLHSTLNNSNLDNLKHHMVFSIYMAIYNFIPLSGNNDQTFTPRQTFAIMTCLLVSASGYAQESGCFYIDRL